MTFFNPQTEFIWKTDRLTNLVKFWNLWLIFFNSSRNWGSM